MNTEEEIGIINSDNVVTPNLVVEYGSSTYPQCDSNTQLINM